jgi:hypothetical protein
VSFFPTFESKKSRGNAAMSFLPRLEQLESVLLLSFADGNGSVVTSITESSGGQRLVITFDGHLKEAPARDIANYQITRAPENPELITTSGPTVKIISASFRDTSSSHLTRKVARWTRFSSGDLASISMRMGS